MLDDLYDACANGDAQNVLLLVASGWDVDQVGLSGMTPLMIACRKGQAQCVTHLVAAGAALEEAGTELDTLQARLLQVCQQSGPDLKLRLQILELAYEKRFKKNFTYFP